MRFAKGHVPDSRDFGYGQHHELVGASPPSLETPDHRPFRSGWIWQSSFSECVPCSVKRAVQLWHAMAGDAPELMISDPLLYATGREIEDAGLDPDTLPTQLEDRGTQPGLVLLAAQTRGVVLEADYKGPTFTDFDQAVMFKRAPPDVLAKAYDGRGLQFYAVTPGLNRLRDAIRECMVRRNPVIFPMFVDGEYEHAGSNVITSINEADPRGGGHMQLVLDASDEETVLIDNFWANPAAGIYWGSDGTNGDPPGTARMTWACFEEHAKTCLAVTSAPLLPRAA